MTSNPPYNGVGRVFTIYINHRGGNIVHKHKTIQFDAVGEGPARHLFLDYLGTIDNNKSKRIKHGSRALFLPRKIFLKTSKITLCLLSMCCLFISVSSFHKCKKKRRKRPLRQRGFQGKISEILEHNNSDFLQATINRTIIFVAIESHSLKLPFYSAETTGRRGVLCDLDC